MWPSLSLDFNHILSVKTLRSSRWTGKIVTRRKSCWLSATEAGRKSCISSSSRGESLQGECPRGESHGALAEVVRPWTRTQMRRTPWQTRSYQPLTCLDENTDEKDAMTNQVLPASHMPRREHRWEGRHDKPGLTSLSHAWTRTRVYKKT